MEQAFECIGALEPTLELVNRLSTLYQTVKRKYEAVLTEEWIAEHLEHDDPQAVTEYKSTVPNRLKPVMRRREPTPRHRKALRQQPCNGMDILKRAIRKRADDDILLIEGALPVPKKRRKRRKKINIDEEEPQPVAEIEIDQEDPPPSVAEKEIFQEDPLSLPVAQKEIVQEHPPPSVAEKEIAQEDRHSIPRSLLLQPSHSKPRSPMKQQPVKPIAKIVHESPLQLDLEDALCLANDLELFAEIEIDKDDALYVANDLVQEEPQPVADIEIHQEDRHSLLRSLLMEPPHSRSPLKKKPAKPIAKIVHESPLQLDLISPHSRSPLKKKPARPIAKIVHESPLQLDLISPHSRSPLKKKPARPIAKIVYESPLQLDLISLDNTITIACDKELDDVQEKSPLQLDLISLDNTITIACDKELDDVQEKSPLQLDLILLDNPITIEFENSMELDDVQEESPLQNPEYSFNYPNSLPIVDPLNVELAELCKLKSATRTMVWVHLVLSIQRLLVVRLKSHHVYGILFLSKVCGNPTLGHIDSKRIEKPLSDMNDCTQTYDPEDQFVMLLEQMELERHGFKPSTIKTMYSTHVLPWATNNPEKERLFKGITKGFAEFMSESKSK